jgi:hypothetical protein
MKIKTNIVRLDKEIKLNKNFKEMNIKYYIGMI